jgi:hypothetical protein
MAHDSTELHLESEDYEENQLNGGKGFLRHEDIAPYRISCVRA